MTYSFKKSVIENEKEFELLENELLVRDLKTQNVVKLAFQQIKQVHLKFVSKKNVADTYICIINTKNGESILLQNQHFKGFGTFENRSKSYTIFLKAFHKKIANLNIEFIKGTSSMLNTLAMFVFSIIGVLAILISLLALFPYGIIIILLVIYFGFRLKKHYKKNKNGTYAPLELPNELLP